MEIRLASVKDAKAIREIYEPYVKNTAVSFEYEVPSVEEMERRIGETLKQYPYLVAVEQEKIVGYAYAGPFHVRQAYKHSAELSVYIDQSFRKMNIGRKLYARLEEMLILQNVYTVHACIASPEVNDEYLNDDSERFHTRMGFKISGRHKLCGYKFGRWYSVIWMDKELVKKTDKVNDFIPFGQVGVRV